MALEPDYFKNLANAQKSFLEHTANRLNVEMIDINLLSADPNQPRKNFDVEALNELAEDIKQKGLIQAIIVRKDPGNIGKYIVVAGERRLKACLLAGLEKIKCEINDSYSDVDLGYVQMAENIKRDELKFYEMAEFIISRVEKGEKQNFIADKLGMKKSAITEYLCWKDAPEFLKAAKECFSSGRAFYELVKLAEDFSEDVQEFIQPFIDDKKNISIAEARKLKNRLENSEETVNEDHSITDSVSKNESEISSSDPSEDKGSVECVDSSSVEDLPPPAESIDIDDNSDGDDHSEFDETVDETVPFNESEDESLTLNEDQNPDQEESLFSEDDNSSESVTAFEDETNQEESGFKKMKLSKVYAVGTVDGREARLRIDLKPETDGFIVVEWEDSSLEEVIASSFVINRIFEE